MSHPKSNGNASDRSAANLGFEAKLWLAADKLRNNSLKKTRAIPVKSRCDPTYRSISLINITNDNGRSQNEKVYSY